MMSSKEHWEAIEKYLRGAGVPEVVLINLMAMTADLAAEMVREAKPVVGEAYLAAVRERHAASTPGEWNPHNWTVRCGGKAIFDGVGSSHEERLANIAFAAHAHQDVPRLLDAIDQRDAVIDDIQRDAGRLGQDAIPANRVKAEVLRLRGVIREVIAAVDRDEGRVVVTNIAESGLR